MVRSRSYWKQHDAGLDPVLTRDIAIFPGSGYRAGLGNYSATRFGHPRWKPQHLVVEHRFLVRICTKKIEKLGLGNVPHTTYRVSIFRRYHEKWLRGAE
jgi:hypothetical protein